MTCPETSDIQVWNVCIIFWKELTVSGLTFHHFVFYNYAFSSTDLSKMSLIRPFMSLKIDSSNNKLRWVSQIIVRLSSQQLADINLEELTTTIWLLSSFLTREPGRCILQFRIPLPVQEKDHKYYQRWKITAKTIEIGIFLL